jgi:hypothetical protein
MKKFGWGLCEIVAALFLSCILAGETEGGAWSIPAAPDVSGVFTGVKPRNFDSTRDADL